MSDSPIKLIPEDARLTTFPLARPALYAWYQDAVNCFWSTNDLDLSGDAADYLKLSAGDQHFVKYILAFFAASDGIVNLNLAERFKKDIRILEAQYFYDFQVTMENIHATTYSMLLDTIIPSPEERYMLLHAMETIPIVQKISQYMFKCIESSASLAERLLRMACVEGILFTGCFCAIYWLQERGVMRGLGHSNELIARDEALHTLFAMFLYNMISPDQRLSREDLVAVIVEAVNLAKEFCNEALPHGLVGMNAGLMIPYIECQADNLVALIDQPKIYGSTHDLKFMEQLNLPNRTNFFERRVSEYSQAKKPDSSEFELNDDI